MWRQIKLALTRKKKLARPIQLIVFVTDRCNARCVHCFNWRALNQGEDGLSLEELERLSRDLGPLLTVGISGGEPFLRADIANVCATFMAHNDLRDIAIPTNGLMPARIASHIREMLARDLPARITLSRSLDGLSDVHDRIRGVPGNFDRVHETYRALVALREAYPHHPPIIKVATTLCNWNVDQVPELIDWVRAEMPAVDFHNFEIMRGAPRDVQIGPPGVEELEWVKPHIFRAWERYTFYGRRHPVQSWLALGLKRFIFTMYIEMIRQRKQLIPCHAARTSAVVDASGNLYFCELREPIGNLHQASWREIWHSECAERVRASIERGDCYCVHSCFQQKNVFLNPRLWTHVIRYQLTGRFTLPPPSHIQPLPPEHGETSTHQEGDEAALSRGTST